MPRSNARLSSDKRATTNTVAALRFLTGVKCFFSGVRFNPAIYRMASHEARLSVSEGALFTIQVLTFFRSFTKPSISA
jgi:hypothetical protein